MKTQRLLELKREAENTLCCRLCGLCGHDAPTDNICSMWRACLAFELGKTREQTAELMREREKRREYRRMQLGLDPAIDAPSPYPAPNEDRERHAPINDDKNGWLRKRT